VRARLAYRKFIDLRTGKSIPVEGGYFYSLWSLVRGQWVSLAEVTKETGLKMGPYYANSLSLAPGVTFCDPEDVRTVLKKIDEFPKDQSVTERVPILGSFIGFQNLFFVNNPNWHSQRSLLNKAFVSNGIFFQPTSKKVKTCLSKWETQQEVCVGSDVQKLTLDVLASCIFGLDFDTLNGQLSEPLDAYNYSLETTFNPLRVIFPWVNKLPLKYNDEMIKNINIFDKYCWKIIDDTRKKMEEKTKAGITNDDQNECLARSIIEMMIENNLSEQEVRDNLSVFFLVGHETTSNSIAWLLAVLSSNQEVQQKARQEIIEKIPGEVTIDSLKELPYIDGLIKECLRMYSPVPFINGRIAAKDSVVGNIQIPAGTNITLNISAMVHDPKIWVDPEVIRPERWYFENLTKEQRNAWMPFSSGPRICIGMNFSLIEQKIFLVNFLKHFQKIQLAPNSIITPRLGGIGTYTPDTDKIRSQLDFLEMFQEVNEKDLLFDQ
jgi:cytochrome P450